MVDDGPDDGYTSRMATKTKSSLGEYDTLSTAEKILHLQDLWDKLAASPNEVRVTQSQKVELDRLLAEYRADPHRGSSWAVARDRIRKRKR